MPGRRSNLSVSGSAPRTRTGPTRSGRERLPACLPDSGEVRSDVADYYFEVQRFDSDVGELLQELENRDELESTMIIMTG